jgi:hypothetical protein
MTPRRVVFQDDLDQRSEATRARMLGSESTIGSPRFTDEGMSAEDGTMAMIGMPRVVETSSAVMPTLGCDRLSTSRLCSRES